MLGLTHESGLPITRRRPTDRRSSRPLHRMVLPDRMVCRMNAGDRMKAPKNFEITVEKITPTRAAEMLTHNETNRRLERRRVDNLVQEFCAGNWKLNGDAIRFYTNGDLADGQHRLTACVESGVSFLTVIIRGVPLPAMPTIDRGRSRTRNDVLKLQGMTNTERLSGSLRYIVGFLKHGDPLRSGSQQFQKTIFSDQAMFELLEEYPGIIDAAEGIGAYQRAMRILTPSTATALYFMFRTLDEDDADRFFLDLDTGVGLTAVDPVYRLRERLMRDRADMTRRGPQLYHHWMKLAGAAWNMRRRGIPCRSLQSRPSWSKLI